MAQDIKSDYEELMRSNLVLIRALVDLEFAAKIAANHCGNIAGLKLALNGVAGKARAAIAEAKGER
jgi:hypothetical protein